MIQRCENWDWSGSDLKIYRDQPDGWRSVTRRELMPLSEGAFQIRYFEVGSGGFTSFEQHCHEHCVVVIRGKGRVRLGDTWSTVGLHDAVHVPPMTPHQFQNPHEEPLGILCVVDRERDRPIHLDTEGRPRTSS